MQNYDEIPKKQINSEFFSLPLGSHGIIEEILVGQAYSVLQFRLVSPAQFSGFAYIEKLTWCAVRTGGIPLNLTRIPHYLGHQLSECLDGEFLTRTGVHRLVAAVVVHQEHAEVCQVVHI